MATLIDTLFSFFHQISDTSIFGRIMQSAVNFRLFAYLVGALKPQIIISQSHLL